MDKMEREAYASRRRRNKEFVYLKSITLYNLSIDDLVSSVVDLHHKEEMEYL